MQIRYEKRGDIERATFQDHSRLKCLAESWDSPGNPTLFLGGQDDVCTTMVLTQSMVRALIPVLERFAATGRIMPEESSDA